MQQNQTCTHFDYGDNDGSAGTPCISCCGTGTVIEDHGERGLLYIDCPACAGKGHASTIIELPPKPERLND